MSNEEACEFEILRIKELRLIGQAKCNFTNGGTGWSTGSLNPTCLKPHYGDSNGMRTKNIDFSGENNPFYGRKHSEETKKLISEHRKGKGQQIGKNNPMYGNGHLIAGEKNGMYGKRGVEAPNAILFLITYLDGSTEIKTSKECEKKFGIAFQRIRKDAEGILHYKKKTPKDIYEGVKIQRLIER